MATPFIQHDVRTPTGRAFTILSQPVDSSDSLRNLLVSLAPEYRAVTDSVVRDQILHAAMRLCATFNDRAAIKHLFSSLDYSKRISVKNF